MNANYALEKLFEGVVPERTEEVAQLIAKYSAQFRVTCDRDGFNIAAGPFGAIQFTNRSMDQMWLFGYAGLTSLHCYATLIVLLKYSGTPLSMEAVKKIPDQQEIEDKFAKLLEKIQEINRSASEYDYSWPEGVPTAEQGRQADAERALVFDLSCMAAAYVFLHELKHAMFTVDGDAPDNPLEEELACDAFAKEMMTSQIAHYSKLSGYPENAVKTKRFMGIVLASAFLLFATPKSKLKGSETHPAIHVRWQQTIEGLDLPNDDYLWLYFGSLTLAVLQKIGIPIQDKKVVDFRSFCVDLIEDLEKSI